MKVQNQKKLIKLLKQNGWTQEAGGKHSVKMCKPKCRPITLPRHGGKDYGPELTASILKAAGLSS